MSKQLILFFGVLVLSQRAFAVCETPQTYDVYYKNQLASLVSTSLEIVPDEITSSKVKNYTTAASGAGTQLCKRDHHADITVVFNQNGKTCSASTHIDLHESWGEKGGPDWHEVKVLSKACSV